ncbi:MAG: hypothetical protein RLZZ330_1135 [Actinomycetota bacterium]
MREVSEARAIQINRIVQLIEIVVINAWLELERTAIHKSLYFYG